MRRPSAWSAVGSSRTDRGPKTGRQQVHGGIDLQTDVDSIVRDPSFQGTDVHHAVSHRSERYDVKFEWHAGSELAVERIPSDFRGPTMPEVGARAARTDGVIDARSIGAT